MSSVSVNGEVHDVTDRDCAQLLGRSFAEAPRQARRGQPGNDCDVAKEKRAARNLGG